MDDILDELKPLLLILFGWLLGTIKDFYKSRKEEKAALKLCLSNLLEVHYLIQKTDVIAISDKLLTHLVKEFPEIAVNGSIPPFVRKNFEQNIHLQVVDTVLSRFPKIKEDYDKSLEGLKPIDPILAHKLSGRTELANYINAIGSYMDQADPELKDHAMKEELIKFISPRFRTDILEITEDDILTVARKIGWSTYFRAKKELKAIQLNWDDNQELETYYADLRIKFKDSLTSLPQLDGLQTMDFTDLPNGDILTQFQELILEAQQKDQSSPAPE